MSQLLCHRYIYSDPFVYLIVAALNQQQEIFWFTWLRMLNAKEKLNVTVLKTAKSVDAARKICPGK